MPGDPEEYRRGNVNEWTDVDAELPSFWPPDGNGLTGQGPLMLAWEETGTTEGEMAEGIPDLMGLA